MSSSDEDVLPDQQLRFDLTYSDVRPQRPHTSPEDAELQELPGHASVETLCLRRTDLTDIEGSIVKNSMLKYLYLEGNHISSIPDCFFSSLPNLLWLDLRNNQIALIPAEIGLHRCLKTLLLEGNPISELPPELGNVITLTGLNLRYCPITFPPQDIVDQGVQSILQYLRSAMARRPVSEKKIPPPAAMVISLADVPVVERLQLSEVMGSSVEEQEESVDEDELQRFKELKHKMILLDKAELGLAAPSNRRSCLPIAKRKKATTKAGIIPELSLLDSQHLKKPEERKQAAQKELEKRQTCLEQGRKNQEALHMWRTQARIAQEKRISQHGQWEHDRQRKQESQEAESDLRAVMEDNRDSCLSQPLTESGAELERQIHTLAEKMQERQRNPKGTSTEQMAAAERDMEEIRKLQVQLQDRKRYQTRDRENGCYIITADTWQSFLFN